ncbi:DUF3597 domain-containing protein [Ramlibacter sp.]|uniref:DUF3597 domain-containing protein n=1 Tax=Ramlibacter sp. TaxID=1917967 RepID=UPI0026022510|nr:DUF3597 domain-containing protein [Ramlibacter sp.]MDB5955628.1 hypothetical protein [Ramlibacter sp.]
MSILGKIFSRILPHANAAQAPAMQAPGAQAPAAPQSAPTPQAATPARPAQPQAAPQGAAANAGATGAATATTERVDVEKTLDGLAANNPQKLNWRNSIVDLMKLVGMDSTLQERKELADELGYTRDKSDTAAMNAWLHKEVLRKLEENGGKVPANLMD